MPICVERPHQVARSAVATVHGDDITIGGQRTVVEFFIKMISREYGIRKQVIGEEPDLEKSGRILNRASPLRQSRGCDSMCRGKEG